MMDNHNLFHNVKKCLLEIELIISKKEMIMYFANKSLHLSYPHGYIDLAEKYTQKNISEQRIDKSDLFNLRRGLCRNADLWSLDHYYFDSNLGHVSILEYLGRKWIKQGDKGKNHVNPVPDFVDGIHYISLKLWANPERWKYTEFVRDELTYFIEHGEFKNV